MIFGASGVELDELDELDASDEGIDEMTELMDELTESQDDNPMAAIIPKTRRLLRFIVFFSFMDDLHCKRNLLSVARRFF